MFYDVHNFPFLVSIIEQSEILCLEFEQQKKTSLLHGFMNDDLPEIHSHTDYWIKEGGFAAEQIGYDSRNGTFGTFPLFKKGFPIKWYNLHETFPLISNAILSVPNVNFATFTRIAPNSGVDKHTHLQSNLIFHLCLTDVDGTSILNCNGEERVISKKGDYVLFDYSMPHSSFNYGKADRINLAIDFSIK